MQFASRQIRGVVLGSILGVVPYLIIPVLVAMAFPDEWWVAVIATLAALVAVLILLWVVRSGIAWFLFLLQRRSAASQLAGTLARLRYPEPEEYENSAEHYFERVAGDESADPSIRVKAAADVALFSAYRSLGEAQALLRFSIIAERAIELYKRHCETTNGARTLSSVGVSPDPGAFT